MLSYCFAKFGITWFQSKPHAIESAFSGEVELSTNFAVLFSKCSHRKKNKIKKTFQKSEQFYVISLKYI